MERSATLLRSSLRLVAAPIGETPKPQRQWAYDRAWWVQESPWARVKSLSRISAISILHANHTIMSRYAELLVVKHHSLQSPIEYSC